MASQQPTGSISFNCPNCNKPLRVRNDFAGKNVQCPGCQGVIRVPATDPAAITQSIPQLNTPKAPAGPGRQTAPVQAAPKPATRIIAPSSKSIQAFAPGTTKPATSSQAVKSPTSKISGRLPAVKAQPQTAREAPSKKKKIIFIASGAAVLVLIIGLALFLSHRSNQEKERLLDEKKANQAKREEEAEQARLQQAKEALSEISRYEQLAPVDFKGILKKIAEKEKDVEDTPTEAELKAKKEEINAKLDIYNAVRDAEKNFNKNQTDYDSPLKEYEKLKSDAQATKNPDALVTEIDKFIGRLNDARKKEIEKEVETLTSKIDADVDKNKFKNAYTLCGQIPKHLKDLPEAKEAIDKLKEKIKQAEAAYRDKRRQWQPLWDGSGTTGWKNENCTIYIGEEDCLVIANEKPNTVGYALVGEGDWKDYQLEMDFKMVQGAVTIFVRVNPSNPNAGAIPVPLVRKFGGDWEKLSLEIKEGQLTYTQGSNPTNTGTIPDAASPQGGILFYVKSGDKIMIKNIKVKLAE